jgi:hypothetical protein
MNSTFNLVLNDSIVHVFKIIFEQFKRMIMKPKQYCWKGLVRKRCHHFQPHKLMDSK